MIKLDTKNSECRSNKSSATVCFPYVVWNGHPTLKGIPHNGNGIATSSLGGKSEVYTVLVKDIDE